MASLLARPAVIGGRAVRPKAPARKVQKSSGIFFAMPPIAKTSRSWPRAFITAPAARKRRDLKRAWVARWNIGARPRRDAEGEEHIAYLAHRRVGEYPFEIALCDGAGPATRRVAAPITATAVITCGAREKKTLERATR